MKRIAFILAACLALSGCAHSFVDGYEPVIDTKGVDQARYNNDLAECRHYAAQNDPATKAAQGAIAGALAGALIGAAIGGGRLAGFGARVGAADGLAVGAVGGVVAQQSIVRNCMAGRGYSVLG